MKIGGMGEPPEFIRPETYQVRAGDTLESVARSFGVEPGALARENNLAPGGELKAGMDLVLPRQAAAVPDRGWVHGAGEALGNAPFGQSEVTRQAPPELSELVGSPRALLLAQSPAVELHPGDLAAAKLAPAVDENLAAAKLAPAVDENIAAAKLAPLSGDAGAAKLAPAVDENIAAAKLAPLSGDAAAAKLAPAVDENIAAIRFSPDLKVDEAAAKLAPAVDENIAAAKLAPLSGDAGAAKLAPAVDENIAAIRFSPDLKVDEAAAKLAPAVDENIATSKPAAADTDAAQAQSAQRKSRKG